jgi:N-acyl-D-aspartate/D-glutamate deacylase
MSWEEISADWGKSPVDTLIEITQEDVFMEGVLHVRSEGDVRYFLQHPLSMIGSDGTAMAPDGLWGQAKPHPRTYGCYPRILGRYVREYGLLSLEEAIKKMTSDPADRLGISTRGQVSPGKAADLVVFDPDTVLDRATWEDPHRYPTGITDVFVNGARVVENGVHTQVRAGRVLRRGLA